MISRRADKEIIDNLAKDLGMSKDLVEKIFYYQDKFVEKTIKKGKFYGVRIKYLGVFIPLLKKINKVNKLDGANK